MFNYKDYGNYRDEALYQRKDDLKKLLKGRTEDLLDEKEYEEYSEITENISQLEYEIYELGLE